MILKRRITNTSQNACQHLRYHSILDVPENILVQVICAYRVFVLISHFSFLETRTNKNCESKVSMGNESTPLDFCVDKVN